ncbi:MAG TPA: helicase C-terminal domain-containing protein [bacterium]|nr:helicase C-terminal domain-containing protein [bacterium]
MKLQNYISTTAIEKIQNAIVAAKFNEVFFRGLTDDNKLVIDVEIIARGNSFSVPAILRNLSVGDVVIHNHPSGSLTPSDADNNIASYLGSFGVASYIINNAVSEIYAIVEPFEKEHLKKIENSEIEKYFSENGILKKLFRGYEYRPQQKTMALNVLNTFNNNSISLIEASTGTGKTISYLIPAILWSITNKEKVVIATNTINLQEQIIEKDLPVIRKILPLKFEYILVKGRNNYICLNRLYKASEQPELFNITDKKHLQLNEILEWIKITDNGSKSSLNFIPLSELWDEICSETDNCMHTKCKYFQECFVNKMRIKANSANILVVNHHILLSDIMLKFIQKNYKIFGVLPEFRRLIIDEAHNIDDTAIKHLGADFSSAGLDKILSKFYHLWHGKEKGKLAYIRNKIIFDSKIEKKEKILEFINNEVIVNIKELRDEQKEYFLIIKNYFCERQNSKKNNLLKSLKIRITDDILCDKYYLDECEILLSELLKKYNELSKKIEKAIKLYEKLISDNDKESQKEINNTIINELTAIMRKIDSISANIKEFVNPQNFDNNVRWIEIPNIEKDHIEFYSMPIDVSEIFFESVIVPHKTIIFTSATLTISKEFNFFKKSLGVDKLEEDNITKLILDTPFNYKEQAKLIIPRDLPEPDNETFTDRTSNFLKDLLFKTERNTFLLFTSYLQLQKTLNKLRAELSEAKFNVLVQGEESRRQLIDKFRKQYKSVLFATDSFWEGVDVRGDALEIVVLFKLPFKTPDDPIVEAKTEYLKRHRHNAFNEYQLPKAVIKLKQGVGRLIRTKNDKGIIVILDNRIKTKNYGSKFLKSLPADIPIVYEVCKECMNEIEFFFKR